MSAGFPPRFDTAYAAAAEFLHTRLAQHLEHIVLVRDLYGRLRLAVDDRASAPLPDAEKLAGELHARLGRFSPGAGEIFLQASRMFAPDDVFESPDVQRVEAEGARYRVLERSLIGADWLREPIERPDARGKRLVLYGIKGGVGRSTAGAVLAWRLAQQGQRVLVVDLDLESPGVGSMLLPDDGYPDYGVVDWLVEEAVGQADEGLLANLVGCSPLDTGEGKVWVVPAGGHQRKGYTYLPKLARAYLDLAGPWRENSDTPPRTRTFAGRLADMLSAIEKHYEPDITILDSRAGLHDIAAVTVTRLQATTLLFAVDTPQTWHAYRALFESWQAHAERTLAFRENLKLVAALTPETETDTYLQGFREHAYEVFTETLYEETAAEDLETFSFALDDEDAPHVPLRVHWMRALQQFDPVHHPQALTDEQLRAGFGDFVSGVCRLVFGEDVQ